MYIDSLTITALVVFIIAMALFVRCCLVHVCGAPRDTDKDHPQDRGQS